MSSAVAGRYEILGKLVSTATSELFVARTIATHPPRLVVLKRLRRAIADDVLRAVAFSGRARLAAKIEHPNVAQVFEVGKLGGSPYCALELVDGETLRALIEYARGRRTPIPLRAVLTLAAGAASGLHHTHERRGNDGRTFVHGAVSSETVMLSRDGVVKLVGHARVPGAHDPVYASPELLDGGSIDRRSDLFSLGAVLWELLTLEPLPRDVESPPAPSTRRYELPKELDAIVMNLLAPEAYERFSTGFELATAIETLASRLEISTSTTDLARVMRLWFGDPSPASEEPKPLVLDADGGDTPTGSVDAMLDDVRADAAAIRSLVAASVSSAAARRPRTTVIPTGEAEGEARESFEQARDRILANARPRSDTGRVTPAEPRAKSETQQPPTRKKSETLPPSNPYAYITNVTGKGTPPRGVATDEPPVEPAEPAPARTKEPTPAPARTKEPTPAPARTKEPTPAPARVRTKEPTPAHARPHTLPKSREPIPPPRARWIAPTLAGALAVVAVVAVFSSVKHSPQPSPPENISPSPSPSPPPPPSPSPSPSPSPPPSPPSPPSPPVSAAPPDARVDAPITIAAAAPPDATPPRVHHRRVDTAPSPSKDDRKKDDRTIEQLFAAGELAKASAGCKTTTEFNPPRLVDCALAACRLHDIALAQRWLHALANPAHDEVATACRQAGAELEAPAEPPQ